MRSRVAGLSVSSRAFRRNRAAGVVSALLMFLDGLVDDVGDLVLATAGAPVRLGRPVVYQEIDQAFAIAVDSAGNSFSTEPGRRRQ